MAVTKWVVFAILVVLLLPPGREMLEEMARELSEATRALRLKEEGKPSSNRRGAEFERKYAALKNSR